MNHPDDEPECPDDEEDSGPEYPGPDDEESSTDATLLIDNIKIGTNSACR